jgi:hypothetical protein
MWTIIIIITAIFIACFNEYKQGLYKLIKIFG